MATAQDIIDRSLRLLGVYDSDSGATPTATQRADGLVALNDLLDSWSNEQLLLWDQVSIGPFSTVAGTNSYTIGTGGTFSTTRPIRLEAATLTDGANDYPLLILYDAHRWRAILNKSLQFRPEVVYYDPEFPLGKIYLYGTPDKVYTLTFDAQVPFTTFATLATAVSMPPGWQRAFALNLAVELAPEYEDLVVNPLLVQRAGMALFNLKRTGHKPAELLTDLGANVQYNILSDAYSH